MKWLCLLSLILPCIVVLTLSGISCAPADTVRPSITEVLASNITATTAIITWTTNEPATSQVEWGTTTICGSSTTLSTLLQTRHSVSLSGLMVGTTYYFRVNSKDSSGNEAASVLHSFATLGTRVGGTILSNTTWAEANSPYVITDTVRVPSGICLTIEPGALVTKSTDGLMFLLDGTLIAHGTINDKIVFDGGGHSDFFGAYSATSVAFLDIDYCVIRNGGNFWSGYGSSPFSGSSNQGYFNLRHSELMNVWGGLILETGYTANSSVNSIYIEYNTFRNTGGFTVGYFCDAYVYIRYNLFIGTPDGSYVVESDCHYGGRITTVRYNSFVGMSGVILKLGDPFAKMSATENYWATQDPFVIDSMIYDKHDDVTLYYIDYAPILTEPHPDAPNP